MNRAVLDTSVLIKSIFEPLKSLPDEIYAREMKTHHKASEIVRLLEERNVDVFIPKVCIIEIASVVSRYADKKLATKVSRRAMGAYEVVDEDSIFEDAWEVASSTGCSGFDTYFISLAGLKRAILLTDDNGMHNSAKRVRVESLLIREIDMEDIKNLFKTE